ncbi:MAG TPA: hypothetical protein VF783_14360 [Terriglobales bacterium]
MAPSAFSYIPEGAWNDTSGQSSGNISATGGGVSTIYPAQSWQTGPGVPSPATGRYVPDLAFAASPSSDGYLICSQSSCVNGYRNAKSNFDVIGGTSAGTPTYAGILALYNQVKGGAQGNINSQLYSIVSTYPLPGNSNTSWAYNDITTGNNIIVCRSGSTGCPTSGTYGYSAGAGYDQVTGLGSVDATAFIDALNNTPDPHFTLLPNSRSESLSVSSNAVFNVAVNSNEGFTGNVALTCTYSTSLTGATCNIQHPTISATGNTGINIGPGSITTSATGTLTVTGTSGSLTDSATINVTFTNPDFQLSSANSSESVSQGSLTADTITITPVQGFSGNVGLSCTGTTGLTCSVSPSTVTISSSAATSNLNVNASGTATTGSITITGSSSSATHTLQIPVTVSPTTPGFSIYAHNSTISLSSGGTTTDNLTVAAIGSFNSDVALTCSVVSSLQTTTCTISPTTVSAGNGTAVITIQAATLSKDTRPAFPFRQGGAGTYASLIFTLGVVFTSNPARRRSGKKALPYVLFGSFLLIVMFGATSCSSGSSSSTTSLSGTVTITGTGGGITNTVLIDVSVT